MALVDVEVSINGFAVSDDVAGFLREAELRVSQFVQSTPVCASGFVPSDFRLVYQALRAVTDANLAPGPSLCEWGSGFGVVASLAAMLDFSAYGIEIDANLVDLSRRLADDFALPVEFVQGSFIPTGAEGCAEEAYAEDNAEYSWLVTDADGAYEELGLDPDDFDVVFAYPWPGEEHVIDDLFESYAAEGALLLTYNYLDLVRVRRKLGGRSGGS